MSSEGMSVQPFLITVVKKVNFVVFLILLFILMVCVLAELTEISGLEKNAPTWTEGQKMPTARTELMADSVDDKIYVMGGIDYSKNYQYRKVEVSGTRSSRCLNL
jgi:hypothetical protein